MKRRTTERVYFIIIFYVDIFHSSFSISGSMIDLGFMFLIVLQRKTGRIIFEFTSRMHSNAQRLFQDFLTDEYVTNLIELILMTALSQRLRNFGGHISAVEFSENFKNIYTLLPSTTQKKSP